MKKPDKYADLKEIIIQIFKENKGRYGYRRITMELHNRGYMVNHKIVRKLMKICGLKCEIRRRKHHSYKGENSKIADNILNRNFKADKPLQKIVTDVIEFKVKEQKVYLSPILDLHNGEIISYNISLHPDFQQTMDTLDKVLAIIPDGSGTILHSDQGLMKTEMYYKHEFKSAEHLIKEIEEYIEYYNNK